MPGIELATVAVAILAAFYGIWAKHMLDRAKAIDEKARSLLSTYRRLDSRIKMKFAQQLARMTDPEDVMQYVSVAYARYYSARRVSRRLERLVLRRAFASPARQFTYLGPPILLVTSVLVLLATDSLTATIVIGYGIALLSLLGYFTNKPLDDYEKAVILLERAIDEITALEAISES